MSLFFIIFVLCFSNTTYAQSPGLTIKVNIDGKSEVVVTYSKADLQKMPQTQQVFSSVDKMPAPVIVLAQGISFSDWLKKAGIEQSSLINLTLKSADNWSQSFSSDFLFAKSRYYYPSIVTKWDKSSADKAQFFDGAEEGKVQVSPILALQSSETRFASKLNWEKISSSSGFRFCFGQEKLTDDVNSNYGKNINEIELDLVSGTDVDAIKAAIAQNVPSNTNTNTEEDDNSVEQGSGEAGLISDTLTIKVGYFGGPYTVKKVFTLADLESMPQVTQAYTWIDRMPAVVTDSARGVKLSDILASAGIDEASVETFYFYCKDISSSWYQDLPKAYLLDTTRYYYPNLSTHWDRDLQASTLGASVGAEEVPTIIAIEDNWQRFAEQPDFEHMNADNRFRLVFGQTDTNTQNAYRSAKWIHCIEVMLGGTASKGVYLDENTLQLKIGSTFQLNATVEAADENTDKRVVWASDKPNIVKVDANGNVTMLSVGQATISVTSITGNKTAVCIVNGADSTQAGMEVTKPHDAVDVNPAKEFLLADDNDAGLQPWRIYEMSTDAVAMPVPEVDKSLVIYAGILVMLFFFLGVIKGCFDYKREVK